MNYFEDSFTATSFRHIRRITFRLLINFQISSLEILESQIKDWLGPYKGRQIQIISNGC